jgi:aminopeptidase N
VVTGLTQAEAAARSLLVDVESYAAHLDLTGFGATGPDGAGPDGAGPDLVRSRSEIRFQCRHPGAATFAYLAVPAVTSIVLNGVSLDPAAMLADGRLHLDGLAASNVLTVDAQFSYTRSGLGLTLYTDPADGAAYVLA